MSSGQGRGPSTSNLDGEADGRDTRQTSYDESVPRPISSSDRTEPRARPSTRLSNEQITQLAAQVAQILQAGNLNQGASGHLGPSGSGASNGMAGAHGNGNGNGWRPEAIGFFDPLRAKTIGTPAEDIISVGKDVYIRNVHVFVERIQDIAQIKGPEIVRTNLSTYL